MAYSSVMESRWMGVLRNDGKSQGDLSPVRRIHEAAGAWVEGVDMESRGPKSGGDRKKGEAQFIREILSALSLKRPVFSSEKDFQLQLAWEMKHRGWELSLDFDPYFFNADSAPDLFIEKPRRIAIELKYKTASCSANIGGKPFQLKNQGSQDQARYDFFKDISRLEQVVGEGHADRGFAIFLTNEGSYWRTARGGAADAMFHIAEDRAISRGTLQWGSHASAHTKRGRPEPIALSGDYVLGWNDYARIGSETGVFRYLLVEVGV